MTKRTLGLARFYNYKSGMAGARQRLLWKSSPYSLNNSGGTSITTHSRRQALGAVYNTQVLARSRISILKRI